ncbi:MAG: cytochrome b/b6 domain-containing protein [Actinobacteria bacterium]|nr:cytochrome b/b6 domain-containing protein [Cyanobacteriota bacterium]MCL5772226.1 cytochrome b/b6 domain-containing protein [Actinomycetota bacterium]
MEETKTLPVKKIGDATYIFKHTIVTRIMHGLHLISMIMLILTGFYIYAPATFRIFPDMDVARYIHFIFMYIIGWAMIYKTYYTIVTGEIKELIFRWRDLLELPALIKYYLYGIFVGAPKKDYGKYNPGQRLIYSMWPVLLLAQGITGIAMYFTQRWSAFNNIFGGLQNIKFIHFIICWIFAITVVAHFYLGSTGPKVLDFYKSVITGWEKHGEKK